MKKLISILANAGALSGELIIPENANCIVLFVHGSGSSRLSPRNNFVARHLNEAGLATLLIDLLTEKEDTVYETRFNIELLTQRVMQIIQWLKNHSETKKLRLGLFGASTGAAAAIRAAAQMPETIQAVVSRGGRPDLATDALAHAKSAILLIVGGDDLPVIDMNESALKQLKCVKKMEIVPHATHLFEEPGTLEQVAELAKNWFLNYLEQ